jgi:hypothetical protein
MTSIVHLLIKIVEVSMWKLRICIEGKFVNNLSVVLLLL